jgi:hypothetical protein
MRRESVQLWYSKEALLAIHPLPFGWAPALPSGAFWLFHVKTVHMGEKAFR